MYNSFKASVLGRKIGDGECVSLIVNNPSAYVETLYPGVSWPNIMAPVGSAKQLAGKGNSYLEWIPNNHGDPNQVPLQGDIAIFDATPQAGYSNTYSNPAGHCGVIDSASNNGIALLQQNAPAFGQAVNVTSYSWKFRPCLGWYRPLTPGTTPPPAPAPPVTTGKTVFLPPTTGPWHLYNDNGPYLPAQAKGVLVPSQFGGLTYAIVEDKGSGIYIINTQMYGQGAIWTAGSSVVVS